MTFLQCAKKLLFLIYFEDILTLSTKVKDYVKNNCTRKLARLSIRTLESSLYCWQTKNLILSFNKFK